MLNRSKWCAIVGGERLTGDYYHRISQTVRHCGGGAVACKIRVRVY